MCAYRRPSGIKGLSNFGSSRKSGKSTNKNADLMDACGKLMESISWLDRYSVMTKRLCEAVIKACRLPHPACHRAV